MSIPKFYGLRIYLSSIMLYFFLVFPFIGFIIFQNVPTFIENRAGGIEQVVATADSLIAAFDSIPEFTEEELDNLVDLAIQGEVEELVDKAILYEESDADTLSESADDRILIGPHPDEEDGLKMFAEKGPFARYFFLLFVLIGVSLLAGLFFNLPFKRFFKTLRIINNT